MKDGGSRKLKVLVCWVIAARRAEFVPISPVRRSEVYVNSRPRQIQAEEEMTVMR